MKKLTTILLNLAKKNPFPVGSIYASDNSTNPSTLFGGTWTQLDGGIMNGNPNSYFWQKGTGNSTITTTSSVSLNSTSFTSNTGKFLVIGKAAVLTSRYTSGLQIDVDGTSVCSTMTNQTSLHHITVFGVYDGVQGQTYTVDFKLTSQDSGTTGTIPLYTAIHFAIVDIPQVDGYAWERTA